MKMLQEISSNTPPAEIKKPYIRSVLIAGGPFTETNVSKFCQLNFLKYEHMIDHSPTRPINPNHDAAIIIVTNASHELYNQVKAKYQGKPLYVLTNGLSAIKESIIKDVWGSLAIHKRLSDINDLRTEGGTFKRGGNHRDHLSLLYRVYWIMARFHGINTEFKNKPLIDSLVDFFGDPGIGHNIASSFARDSDNVFENIAHGRYRFKGIPSRIREVYAANDIPFDEEWFVKESTTQADLKKPVILMRPEVVDEQEPAPVLPATTTTTLTLSNDTQATIDLLLESMAQQQNEMKNMKIYIESTIPKLIQTEIRGITQLLGSLVPKLQGLAPDEIQKVDQMLDLFLGMRTRS